MRSAGDKKATTIRLSTEVKLQLEHVSNLTKTSESHITEKALTEYFEKHGYTNSYSLYVNKDCFSLLQNTGKHTTILEMQVRNGITPLDLQKMYSARVNAHVELVLEEGEGHD